MKGYLQLRRPVGVAEHEYPRERTTSPVRRLCMLIHLLR